MLYTCSMKAQRLQVNRLCEEYMDMEAAKWWPVATRRRVGEETHRRIG
ncbi:hypothetical protein KCP74_21305 [Salmonella enterica subsp. enterica]|nr:hypothetical protein KCP74_21305 [Salmonella enterica subsp. enterica]